MLPLIFFTTFLGLAGAHAQTKKRGQLTTLEKKMIQGNKAASGYFDWMAEGLDAFLSGRRNIDLHNRTRVVLESTTISREGEGIKSGLDVNFDLHLPNLEEYWALKFTSYDENEELRGTQDRYLRRNPRERSYGTSLALVKKLGRIRTRFQPRISLSDPLQISHLLRFETEADMKTFVINPKVEFFARPGKGTGVFAGLNFDFRLTDRYVLTLINGEEYQAFKNIFLSSNGISLSESVSDKISLSYGLLFYSNSRPSYHLENYVLSTTWSQLLYKNVIHFQVVPYLDFSKTESFKGKAGLIVNFQFIF